MNFTETVAQVLSIVKREDKLSDIQREVNAAANFFSADTDFPMDVHELTLPIDVTQYSQLIAFSSLPRFRKMQFIKRAGTSEYLTPTNPAKLPSANCLSDKYYIAGTGIRINQSKLAASMDIGYWQYPPYLSDAIGNNTYWMLDMYPFMVIDRAASVIFTNIGDDASARAHALQAAMHYTAAKGSILASQV